MALRVTPPAHPETTPKQVEVIMEVGEHTEKLFPSTGRRKHAPAADYAGTRRSELAGKCKRGRREERPRAKGEGGEPAHSAKNSGVGGPERPAGW